MPGESDNPETGAGRHQTNGSRIEISLVDLVPPPQIELASRGPSTSSREDLPVRGETETREHFEQRNLRYDFEVRLDGAGSNAREINSRDVNQIQSRIRPGDVLEIRSGDSTKYYKVDGPNTISDGVREHDLRQILQDALRDPNARIRRAPPLPRTRPA